MSKVRDDGGEGSHDKAMTRGHEKTVKPTILGASARGGKRQPIKRATGVTRKTGSRASKSEKPGHISL